MAEWSKAPDSRFAFPLVTGENSGPRMRAWVRTPLLTDTFRCCLVDHTTLPFVSTHSAQSGSRRRVQSPALDKLEDFFLSAEDIFGLVDFEFHCGNNSTYFVFIEIVPMKTSLWTVAFRTPNTFGT